MSKNHSHDHVITFIDAIFYADVWKTHERILCELCRADSLVSQRECKLTTLLPSALNQVAVLSQSRCKKDFIACDVL